MEHEEEDDHQAQLIETQDALSMMEDKFKLINE